MGNMLRRTGHLSFEEYVFDSLQVGLGVYADRVELRGGDVDVEAVFEEAELFEALGLFEDAVWQGGETVATRPCGRRRGRCASSTVRERV